MGRGKVGRGVAPSSGTGPEGTGGDWIAKSSSPKSKAAMREFLTLEDFSLAKSQKLNPTLKEQLHGNNVLTESKGKVALLCQPLQEREREREREKQ